MKHKILLPILLLGSINAANADTITVDGDLSDWGISPGSGNSAWTPNAGIDYIVEDQTGPLTTYLTPGYGGQAYDAEAMYSRIENGTLYIGMATGHNPENTTYGAGDFAIDFGQDGSYELGINVKPGWDSFGVAGGVYNNITWGEGLWSDNASTGYVKSEHPTSILSGDSLGTASLAISSSPVSGYGDWQQDDHYFYEVGVALNLLTAAGWSGNAFNIHWTMNCANDSILLATVSTLPGLGSANVPEPSTALLILLALISTLSFNKRKAGAQSLNA